MTVTTNGMTTAMRGLTQALEAPRRPGAPLGNWRWSVRQRMADVRDALIAETAHGGEGWLAAREGGLLRERTLLLNRLSALGPRVLESPNVEVVRADLLRLLTDVSHHLQRIHDLAYDEVELELGGSE
ncbi:hypothetical protein GCM10027062_21550 [Nocardioides hungaricus]